MKRSIGAAAAVVLVVGLSACGGGGSKASSDSSDTQGFCNVVQDALTMVQDGAFINDPDALNKVVATFEDGAKKAPSDIKPDVSVLLDAAKKLQSGDTAALLEPATNAKITESSRRLETYLKDTCGIDVSIPSST